MSKTRINFLIILIVCMAAALIAGCQIGLGDKEEFLNTYGVAGQYVTYDANGGFDEDGNPLANFNDKIGRDKIDVYFQPDAYIIANGDTNNLKPKLRNCNFDCWYYVQLDEKGEPKKDADGKFIYELNDEGEPKKVDPNDKVEAGKHYYVVASWISKAQIEFILITDDGQPITVDGTNYNSGESYRDSEYFSGNFQLEPDADPDNPGGMYALKGAKGVTFLSFFTDEECTQPVYVVEKPDDSNTENVKIYAKYLRGAWTVVSNASGVKNMFDLTEAKYSLFYLFSNDGSGVIDCQSITIDLMNTEFKLKVEGNGVIIDNINFQLPSGVKNGEMRGFSIFGMLTSDTSIKDVTFRNVNVSVVTNVTVNLYLVWSDVKEGAVLENINFEAPVFEVTCNGSSYIRNIQKTNTGAYLTENWLFGVYDGESKTDEEFLEEYGGISITNAKLTVDGDIAVDNTDN